MSIFASQTQATVAMPFARQADDTAHVITIRKLTGREVQQAQLDDMFGVAAGNSRTWAARMKRMAATGDPKALEALADPLIGYDRFSIIRAGLLAWTYPESIAIVPATEKTPAIDAVGDLDDEAADFIARAILRLTKPALFVTAEEAVATAQKELPAAAPAA